MQQSFGNLGEQLLEQGQSGVKKLGTIATKQVTTTVKSTASQVIGALSDSPQAETLPGAQANTQNAASDAVQNADRQEFIEELYGPTGQKPQQNSVTDQNGQVPQSMDEQKKLAEARRKLLDLHMTTYYNPTFNRPQQQEEATADKLEREKQQEAAKKMDDLQKKQKENEVPMAVRMGAQRAEKFPGASG